MFKKKGVRYEIGNENKCRIGQPDRCEAGGCEWKKVFGHCCQDEVAVEKAKRELLEELERKEVKPTLTPPKVRKPQIIPPKQLTPGVRSRVYHRDGHRCLKCGTDQELTLDEVVPRSKGGKRSYENCQTLCRTCNGEKGNKTIDYRK